MGFEAGLKGENLGLPEGTLDNGYEDYPNYKNDPQITEPLKKEIEPNSSDEKDNKKISSLK